MKRAASWWAVAILAAGPKLAGAADFGRGDVFVQGGGFNEQAQDGGTWGIYGGGASLYLGRYVSLFGELSYVRLTAVSTVYFSGGYITYVGGLTATGYLIDYVSYSAPRGANLFETGGGARFFIPFRGNRVRPYVPVAGGWLNAPVAAPAGYYNFVVLSPILIRPFPAATSRTANGPYCGTGLGMEIGLTRRFGLRPEFRYTKAFLGRDASPDQMAFTLGAYYRFGKL